MSVRPRVAFFDYADAFEDFYPHYGVSQEAFAREWAATSNHAFAGLIQREVADVVWYALALRPDGSVGGLHRLGFRVRLLRSSAAHRALWWAFYVPGPSWRWRGAYRHYATLASWAAPLSLPLLRALRRDRPDLVFAQSYSSGRFDVLLGIARGLGVPFVAYHTGGTAERWLGARLRRRTIRRADLLIASSAAERALLVDGLGVASERVAVVLTPIDTDAFRPLPREQACREAGLDPAGRYLLFVGRLADHEKRVGALIDAFARTGGAGEDVTLLVVGEGPDGAALRARAAAAAPGRVRFLGWASGPERLAPLYGAADCLLLPSRREGFPTVVGEALACGTPVLGSRVGGIPELVLPGRTGWLVEPGDDAALTERLASLLADPAAAQAMRPAARRLAEERVSPAVVGEALRGCLEPLLRP